MRVAMDADFGQMNNRDITSTLVHRVPPFPRHLQSCAPSILPRIRRRFLRNEVAVIDDNWNPGEQHEFRHRYSNRRQRPTGTWYRSGNFAFREDETAAWFIRDNGADVLVLDGRAPAKAAAVRMGDENPGPDFVEKRGHGRHHHIRIQRACGWGHLAEVLI